VLNVSNDDDNGTYTEYKHHNWHWQYIKVDKQAVGVFRRSNSPLGLDLNYSVANFLVPQILAHGDAKAQLFVVNDELAQHPVEK